MRRDPLYLLPHNVWLKSDHPIWTNPDTFLESVNSRIAPFPFLVFGTSACQLHQRHSDQVLFDILDNRHESHTQERTEHDDEKDFRDHESSNGQALTASCEHDVNFSLT